MTDTAATQWVSEEEIVDLIRRAQAYDAAAFDRLYEVYAHSIFRYLYHRLNDREIAEDLTGEAFLRLMENIGNFRVGPRDQKAMQSARQRPGRPARGASRPSAGRCCVACVTSFTPTYTPIGKRLLSKSIERKIFST